MEDDKIRGAYGNGTVYKNGKRYVAQMQYTIEIDGQSYSKRVSGSGSTSTKAVRRRNKNAEKWKNELLESIKNEKLVELEETQNTKLEETVSEQDDSVMTLNDVFDLNLKRIENQAQVSTWENYEVYYNGYVVSDE